MVSQNPDFVTTSAAATPAAFNADAFNAGATFAATLMDEWARCGVRHVVVSPGSRSTPLAVAAATHPGLVTHVHHDERSASFLALGISLATQVPTVLVCTSGTAAVEYHAAVVEAHHGNVALIVCTADRPPELQGVGAPQTIDQRGLYGSAVRWFAEPGPAELDAAAQWRPLAAEAHRRARGDRRCGDAPGPVHLNLAFREPLLGPIAPLPPLADDGATDVDAAPGDPAGCSEDEFAELAAQMAGRRGVIVCGDRTATDLVEAEAVAALAAALGWPVFSDAQSRMRSDRRTGIAADVNAAGGAADDVALDAALVGVDPLLRVPEVAALGPPEVVVRFGALLTSKVMNQWLADSAALQVGVDRWGAIPDPDHVIGRRVWAEPAAFAARLRDAVVAVSGAAAPREWVATWRGLSGAAREVIDAHATGEVAVARAVLEELGAEDHLVVSSSMPVRDLEWYGGGASATVLSNRGANGIDGVTSTAVGVALASQRPTVCLIGDVAFLHDTNAMLGLASRAAPLCVVVIDNDGGGIFSFLPQADQLDGERFEQLFGTPHRTHLLGLAGAHRIETIDIGSVERTPAIEELREVVRAFRERPRPLVVRVRSDRAANVAAHRDLNDRVAAAARAALGPTGG